MKKQLYWGIGILIFLLSFVCVFLLIPKNTDIESRPVLGKMPQKPLKESSEQTVVGPLTGETETKTVIENSEQAQVKSETLEFSISVSEDLVSPFGFGPYPVVPEDYPISPSEFKWEFWGETIEGELMSRVRIKLWKQGIRSEGASFQNGKVYPIILGTVYIEWDGDKISRMTGHPDDDFDAIEAALETGQSSPEGITIFNYNEAGIDPYTFLYLNKKE